MQYIFSLLFSLLFMSLSLEAKTIDPYKAKNFYHLIGMPGFSDSLLKLHFGLYEGYVNATNLLLQSIENTPLTSPSWSALQQQLSFEFNGMRLHELYFENLGGKTPIYPESKLFKHIVKDFGSFDLWKADFIANGLIRGIGWVIVYLDTKSHRLFNAHISEHQVNLLSDSNILLVLDVWEHAYLTEYLTNRSDYIEAFMKNIDWNIVNYRYEEAVK